jgi:hypothetical protein
VAERQEPDALHRSRLASLRVSPRRRSSPGVILAV